MLGINSVKCDTIISPKLSCQTQQLIIIYKLGDGYAWMAASPIRYYHLLFDTAACKIISMVAKECWRYSIIGPDNLVTYVLAAAKFSD